MQGEYEQLSRKIQNAAQKSNQFELVGEFAVFSKTQARNHPTIIKVIHENKEGVSDGVPHLIYISREKRPKHPHNYKAGAMNVLVINFSISLISSIVVASIVSPFWSKVSNYLYYVQTRISGLMTNAPFMLNVDCDMYVNNSKIVLHALCILLDSKGEKEVAFAQCPQRFYDAVKDDAFGNQLVALPMVG